MSNKHTALRVVDTRTLPSPSPMHARLRTRLNVVIGDEDALSSLVLRTTSFNTIRTLAARLQYLQAVSGGLLACMPLELKLELKLRGKSTTMSFRSAIFYVDLVVRSGMTLEEAIIHARQLNESRRASGLDQIALDEAARNGFANSAFEELTEDVPAVVEEFYPESSRKDSYDRPDSEGPSSLHGRLEKRATSIGSG